MAYLFEEMGETYTLGADGMYYPNLELPKEETTDKELSSVYCKC